MVNADTIWFIGFLNELAEKSEEGIIPFSKASKEDAMKIMYDDSQVLHEYPDILLGAKEYPLVLASIIGEHQQIVTSTENWGKTDISVCVIACEDKMDESYVAIELENQDWTIFIQDGEWWIEAGD